MSKLTVSIVGSNSRIAKKFIKETELLYEFRKFTRFKQVVNHNYRQAEFDTRNITARNLYGSDVVINFTGIVKGPLEEVNVNLAVSAARSAREAGVNHFIQISSLSVYGGADIIDYTTPERPKTLYGLTKLNADRSLLDLQNSNFGVTILRIPMVYGNGCGDKLIYLINFMSKARIFPIITPMPLRSVLHISNASAVISDVIKSRSVGILFAADDDLLDMQTLAYCAERLRNNSILLGKIPASLLLPVKYITPNLYDSLYRSSVINKLVVYKTHQPLPVALQQGLLELVNSMKGAGLNND